MFSKGFFFKVVRSQDNVVELTLYQNILCFNPLPNWKDKNLDTTKLKACADKKMNTCIAKKMISVFDRGENIVGNGEKFNAGYQHFLLLPQCFQKPSIPWSLKLRIVW